LLVFLTALPPDGREGKLIKSEEGLGVAHPKELQIGTPRIKLQVKLFRSHHGKSTVYHQSAWSLSALAEGIHPVAKKFGTR
jgi:hypothetical protein